MSTYNPSVKDMKFLLNDVLDMSLYSGFPRFENIDADLVSSVIDSFAAFAAKELAPLNAVGDKNGAKLGPHGVVSSPGFVDAYRRYAEGGWPSLACGSQDSGALPGIISTSIQEMLSASNLSFSMVAVRRQGFWDNRRRELTEALVHQVCHIRPLHLDEASGAV